jgi:hypothetical protein
MKYAYFKSVMNCLDLIVIILSYICMSFNIYRQVQVNNLLDQLLEKQERQFNDFTFLCYWQYQFNNVVSATIFLAWIKVCRKRFEELRLEFFFDFRSLNILVLIKQ